MGSAMVQECLGGLEAMMTWKRDGISKLTTSEFYYGIKVTWQTTFDISG